MYQDEDVYTQLRMTRSGDFEFITTDDENTTTTFLVEEYTDELSEV